MAALARSFVRRLEDLACPYVDNVDDTWIKELLFKPGEPRLRLLQWLFARFDSHIEELVQTQASRPEHLTDSRIQRLTFVASTLGLCRPEDYDLIRGVSSEAKQAAFMDALLDLVCLSQEAEYATPNSHLSLEPTSGFTRLAEQMDRDRRLLNGLANQENVTEIWASSCQLFPPDLMRLCHQQFDQTMAQSGIPPQEMSRRRMRPPDSGKLDALVSELSKQAASQQEILEQLKQTTSLPGSNKQVTEKVLRALAVSLSTLGQLVSSFCQCYETELQSWTNKSLPHFSGLGPICKRVSCLHQQLIGLLESLSKTKASYESICEKTGIGSAASGKDKQTNQESVKTLKRCVKVLEGCADRHHCLTPDTV
jgi:HAUS augmin-like complex subunit 7